MIRIEHRRAENAGDFVGDEFSINPPRFSMISDMAVRYELRKSVIWLALSFSDSVVKAAISEK